MITYRWYFLRATPVIRLHTILRADTSAESRPSFQDRASTAHAAPTEHSWVPTWIVRVFCSGVSFKTRERMPTK